mgnify:CR=1 FL=1
MRSYLVTTTFKLYMVVSVRYYYQCVVNNKRTCDMISLGFSQVLTKKVKSRIDDLKK